MYCIPQWQHWMGSKKKRISIQKAKQENRLSYLRLLHPPVQATPTTQSFTLTFLYVLNSCVSFPSRPFDVSSDTNLTIWVFCALFEDNNNPATSKHVTFLLVRVTLQRKMHGANQSCVSHLLPSKSTIGCDLHLPPSSWPHDTKFCKSSFLKNDICFQISKWQYQLIRHNNLILVVNKSIVCT